MTATTATASRSTTIELPTNSNRDYESGNLAHRPRAKGGYFPVAPVDSCVDIRAEMVRTMIDMGLTLRQASPRGRLAPSTSSA